MSAADASIPAGRRQRREGRDNVNAVLWSQALSRSSVAARLSGVAGLSLAVADSEDAAADALRGADILVIPHQMFTTPLQAVAKFEAQLSFMQLLTAGYETLDASAVPKGVRVASAGPGLAGGVAEHALTLLLAASRKFPIMLANQSLAKWERSVKDTMLNIYDKTVVVVGFGPIGQEVARLLGAFGSNVVAVSRGGGSSPHAKEVLPVTRLDEALSVADAIVLALPINPDTHHLFDADRFASCKPGAVFVNVGRGATVDTHALAAALDSQHLAAAGVDVVDPEPLPETHPLWQAPNLIVSPHSASGGGYDRLGVFVAQNISDFMSGCPIRGEIRLPPPD